jgi:hypothetical protein
MRELSRNRIGIDLTPGTFARCEVKGSEIETDPLPKFQMDPLPNRRAPESEADHHSPYGVNLAYRKAAFAFRSSSPLIPGPNVFSK